MELFKIKQFNSFMVDEAIKRGGTCTGEHGIGLGKIEYLEKEHGDQIFLMCAIKKSFDPLNIFNPGKIFKNDLINTIENEMNIKSSYFNLRCF